MELIDYVINTPQNTNKTILKQLVNSEKNKAVYESVEELKRGGGVGYTEGGLKSLFFDGDLTGKENMEGLGGYLVKLSDTTFAPSGFIGATIAFISAGSDEIGTKRITDVSFEDVGFGYSVSGDGDTLFAIVTEDSEPFTKGIWTSVIPINGNWYGCIQIDYMDGVIYPISEKYLPGPIVIDLDKYKGDNNMLNLAGALLTLTANGGGSMTLEGGNFPEFWKDIVTNRPVRVTMMADENIASSQAVTIATNDGNGCQLAGTLTIYLANAGGLLTLSYAIVGDGTATSDATVIVKLL